MASSALHRTPRSLADDLRARTPGQISRLLWLRPDLMSPWPTDLSQLARRTAEDTSVLEAMQSLNTIELRVLEVFACLHEATADQAISGLPDEADRVRTAIERLWAMALLWGGPDIHRIARAAQQTFGPFPCGLAPASHVDPDPALVRSAAGDFDESVLRRLVWRDPVHPEAHPILTARGEQFILPREAALLLRDGAYLPAAQPEPEHPPASVPAGHGLWGPIAGVRYVLTDLAREPLAWNPSRGVSRRTLTDRAESMSVPVDDLVVWLELAAITGLIGPTQDWVGPSSAAREWLDSEPAAMWSALIRAWLDSDRPLVACRPDDLGCLTTAGRLHCSLHRTHVLRVWPRQASLDAEGLTQTLAWQRPRMHQALERVPEFYSEAIRLGLVNATVATPALSLLPDDVASAASSVPPAESRNSLIVQPDHTVIAPSWVDSRIWRLLQDIAVLESWGPMTMHRIDPIRLRGAMVGRSADELLDQMTLASKTPIPQSIDYLIRDAARGSAVRVYRATMVESAPQDADTLRDLGLTQVGEQSFVTDLPVDVVNSRLLASGLTTETPDHRPVGQPLEYPGATPLPDEHAVARIVGHLMGEDAHTDLTAPALVPARPESMAAVCEAAIAGSTNLWLEYAAGGEIRTDLVEPVELRSGRLTAWSLTAGRTVALPISQIAAYGDAQ